MTTSSSIRYSFHSPCRGFTPSFYGTTWNAAVVGITCGNSHAALSRRYFLQSFGSVAWFTARCIVSLSLFYDTGNLYLSIEKNAKVKYLRSWRKTLYKHWRWIFWGNVPKLEDWWGRFVPGSLLNLCSDRQHVIGNSQMATWPLVGKNLTAPSLSLAVVFYDYV